MNQWGKRIVGIILAALMLFCEPVIYHSIQASAAQMEKRAFGGTFDDADRPATYEVLTGHESQWWTNTVDSHKYRMKKDASPFLFYVRPATNVGLVVELEQDGNYITTCTNHECWLYPGHMQGYVKSVYSSGLWELNSGKEYAIEVARQDHDNKTDYTITITDLETGNVYGKFMAGDTQMTGEPFVYLKAQVGTFEMYFDGPVYQTHGTDRSRIVSLSDVDNTPPADYKIPDGLVRDAKEGAYEKYFPKDSIQTVSVEMDKKNLDYMLQNAVKKPSVMTKSVKIGDTTVGYAGIKTKGNWTLNSTNDTTSDRFSFTINFGKYIKKAAYGKKQNFYGCSKISFNNCYFDKTILKEYNSMRLMDEMGVPAPQYSLAKLYINGEYYGVYFMVEAMDAAIIERYQNASSKEVGSFLVKPSYTSLNYNFEPELENCLNSSQAKEFTMEALEKAGLLTQKDGVYSVHGVLNNYQGMWESDDDTLQDIAEMLPKALTWNRKIQLLSDGKDFEKNKIDVNSKKYRELLDTVMDTDEALRYFAAHSFLVQLDNMFTWKQNYGIYVDKQGKSLFVPWDYDLAWGTANWNGANTAEQVANWDLDKMYPDKFVNVVNFASLTRDEIYKMAPLFYVIYQNQSLMKKYHLYMEDCAKLVSVGGTVSDGRKVDSARYAGTIDTYFSQVVQAAAVDGLRENVYYLNGIIQPEAAKTGIPVLKKMVARRAVGVWLQTHGKHANVTGYDCEIDKLGTGFYIDKRKPATTGTLTAVDENSGVFAEVTYSSNNTEAWMNAKKMTSAEKIYQTISKNIQSPVVYKIDLANRGNIRSDYKVYIPMEQELKNFTFYSYAAETNEYKKLNMEAVGNVACVTGSDLSYVVAAAGGSIIKPLPTPSPTEEDKKKPTDGAVKKGQVFTAGKCIYKVTKVTEAGGGEVLMKGLKNKKTKKSLTAATIGANVKIKGRTFKITAVGDKAFAGCGNLKSLTIGKHIKKIGALAFANCKKLKKITIQTKLLTKKSVGKKSFSGIHPRAGIKVPMKKRAAYKKILRSGGAVGKGVSIR